MIGLGTLFKKNISRYDADSDPLGHKSSLISGKPREIRPRLYQDICALCGRTILTGERTDLFRSADGNSAVVICPHCRPRAVKAGYTRVRPGERD